MNPVDDAPARTAGPTSDTTSDAPERPNADTPSAARAFDALYTRNVATLTRQAFLLTGSPRLAQEAAERSFHLAWQHWPEVARDHDPDGWVRAAAYEYALAPWHRLRPGRRPPRKIPKPALLDALLRLPAAYRRTVLLHDGVGLGLRETAAEIEASTPAAAGRLTHARAALDARLPELGLYGTSPARQREILHARLAELAVTHPVSPVAARAVRSGSERSTQRMTQGAIGLTGLIAVATTVSLLSGPDDDSLRPPAQPGAAATPAAGSGHGERPPAPPPRAGGQNHAP